jgi:Zn-dependent protease
MIYQLGAVGGLRLSARPSAALGSILLWTVATEFAQLVLKQSFALALLTGALALVLHWASAIWHQLGHAWAARRTGYPMIGIRLWFLLSTARYPSDEPPLPAEVHIRRALGGPLASFALTLVAGALALLLRPVIGPFWWLLVFLCADSLVVFTLGALLPLGFTDGSTLLRWWPQREHQGMNRREKP